MLLFVKIKKFYSEDVIKLTLVESQALYNTKVDLSIFNELRLVWQKAAIHYSIQYHHNSCFYYYVLTDTIFEGIIILSISQIIRTNIITVLVFIITSADKIFGLLGIAWKS